MAKKRVSDTFFDEKAAFSHALEYEFLDEVWVTPELKKFLTQKGVQYAVNAKMFLPSFLVATCNAMGMAKLALTEDWTVNQNIYVLLIAPKGAGKTPSSRLFLGKLVELEREEKETFDEAKKERKKKKKGRKRSSSGEAVDGDIEETEDEEEDVFGEDGAGDDDCNGEAFMFHKKTRVADTITPEALVLTLHYGSGNLVIKSDEFKGFFEKCVEKADNISAICSAFSGEEVKYTTVKRGEISVYDSRLSIFGAIQPQPLGDLLNSVKKDNQGFFDRFLFFAASEDFDVLFSDQMKPIADKDKFNIAQYLHCIRDHHLQPRVYTPDTDALAKFGEYKAELQNIAEASNKGSEVLGMTAKAFSNLQKLSIVRACARETTELLGLGSKPNPKKPAVNFKVTEGDVVAAWDMVKQSMQVYKSFKVALSLELGEEIHKLSDEDLILSGSDKIKKLYEHADENKEVKLSVVRKYNLFPSRTTEEDFSKALVEKKLAKAVDQQVANNRKVKALKLTTETDDKDTLRIFKMLFEKIAKNGGVFDPLNIFVEGRE